jgi:hypothetical protein
MSHKRLLIVRQAGLVLVLYVRRLGMMPDRSISIINLFSFRIITQQHDPQTYVRALNEIEKQTCRRFPVS